MSNSFESFFNSVTDEKHLKELVNSMDCELFNLWTNSFEKQVETLINKMKNEKDTQKEDCMECDQ